VREKSGMFSIQQPWQGRIKGMWSTLQSPTASLLGQAILFFLVLAESLICVFWIYTLSGLGDGYALMAAVPYVYLVFSYASLLLFYRMQRFDYFVFTQLVMLLVMPFFMQWIIGGFEASSGMAIWALLSPVGAMMILGATQSTQWFALFLILAGVSWQLNSLFAGYALPIPATTKSIFFLINLAGVASILYTVLRYFQSQKARLMEALSYEQARSEKLLLSLLPVSIAERLKAGEVKIADRYEHVTILFADLVDFTRLSLHLSPEALLDLLNEVFSGFDRLAAKYGLEKIKTIGDAYMLVCGAPIERPDHAEAVADMALEVQALLQTISTQLGTPLSMRIGINSGPVVAGVIGHSKFSYDLWGDAVNLARRMEQYGIAGDIQVSEATYQLLREHYVLERRGTILIKGHDEQVAAYLLKSRRTAF